MKGKATDESYIFFFTAISGYKNICLFWDQKTRLCNISGILQSIPMLPENEQIMAKFFLAVWTGKNYGFDLIRDIWLLENDDLGTICDWIIQPYLFGRNPKGSVVLGGCLEIGKF